MNSKDLRVIYLDFDGVLHPHPVILSRKQGIQLQTPGHKLFEWAPILDGLLASHPDWRIVLSTSWVFARSFNFSRDKLPAGLRARVIGATYHRREMDRYQFSLYFRGDQILLDARRRQPKHWFAIDDDAEGPPEYLARLIHTNPDLGLSDPRVQERIAARLSV